MKFGFASSVFFASLVGFARATVVVENNFNSNKSGWTYRDDTHFVSNGWR